MIDEITFGPDGSFSGLYDVRIVYKSGKVHRHNGVEIEYLRSLRTYKLKFPEKEPFLIEPSSWSRIEYQAHKG